MAFDKKRNNPEYFFIYLFSTILYGVTAYVLLPMDGFARALGWIHVIGAVAYGLFALAFLLLIFAEWYVTNDEKDKKKVTIKIKPENRQVNQYTFKTKAEADGVLNALKEFIKEYGTATLADYYSQIHYDNDFTCYNYGWRNLDNVRVEGTNDGFVICFPVATRLDT